MLATGIAGEAGNSLMPILTYLQDNSSAFSQDNSLRQTVIHLLHTVVCAAPGAVAQQPQQLLPLLLQLRANVLLSADMPEAQLQQVR